MIIPSRLKHNPIKVPTTVSQNPSSRIMTKSVRREAPMLRINANSYLRSFIELYNEIKTLIKEIIMIKMAMPCKVCIPMPKFCVNRLISIDGSAICMLVSLINVGIITKASGFFFVSSTAVISSSGRGPGGASPSNYSGCSCTFQIDSIGVKMS